MISSLDTIKLEGKLILNVQRDIAMLNQCMQLLCCYSNPLMTSIANTHTEEKTLIRRYVVYGECLPL